MGSLGLKDVFEQFIDSYASNNYMNLDKVKAVNDISQCRTSPMGGHWKVCQTCGDVKVHYNSCSNRHCPYCQGINKEKWILEREYDLLPVKYFHVVFTVPSELRVLFLQNKKNLYNLLFKTAWQTLDEFAKDERQKMIAQAGMIAILHTWTQQLLYHPHIHCIVPAGGINKNREWKKSKGSHDFLFYMPNVAQKFKGKFLYNLNEMYKANQFKLEGKAQPYRNPKTWNLLKDKLYKTNWNVHCKKPFNGPKTVLEYLGRYTHKIAISNYRIKKVSKTHVGFTWLDRNDANKQKYMELEGDKFIGRFLSHILPKGFVRIRHYGFLATRVKTNKLKTIRETLRVKAPEKKEKLTIRDVMMTVYGLDTNLCQTCKEGILLVFERWERNRGSPKHKTAVA